jgi:hypothetical protein
VTATTGTTLELNEQARERLSMMLDDWRLRRSAHDMLGEADKVRSLDESVITALVAMLRLGGKAFADNVDPPSLIVHGPIVYGVSVLNQIGGKWSVDS